MKNLVLEHDLTDYTPGAPSNEAAAIDRLVAETTTCTKCGHVGMIYRPYTRKHGIGVGHYAYRAIALCPMCDYSEEF